MDTMNKLAKKMISGLLCLCYALGADGQTWGSCGRGATVFPATVILSKA